MMEAHVIPLPLQSQTPAHPFIQTSLLFPMLLFLKPVASYFLSLKSPTPGPVPGPIAPRHSPQPHKRLTHKTQSLAKLKGTTNIVWVSQWEEGASVYPNTKMMKVIYKIKQLSLGPAFCRNPSLPPNIRGGLATEYRPSLGPPHCAGCTPRDIFPFYLCPRDRAPSPLPHPPSLGPYHLTSLTFQSFLGG